METPEQGHKEDVNGDDEGKSRAIVPGSDCREDSADGKNQNTQTGHEGEDV